MKKLEKPKDRLLYQIRFQNKGNYAARIVRIIDTLSHLLDLSTIEIESSSHPFNVSIRDGVIRWVNTNIELPDSTSDPEGSNGYVKFSIQPKQGIEPFSLIENKAAIQFDNNDFIITNTTEVIVGPDLREAGMNVLVYPNPVSINQRANLVLVDDEMRRQQIKQLEILNPAGVLLSSIPVNDVRCSISVNQLNPGIYFARLTSVEGNFFSTKFIVTRQKE